MCRFKIDVVFEKINIYNPIIVLSLLIKYIDLFSVTHKTCSFEKKNSQNKRNQIESTLFRFFLFFNRELFFFLLGDFFFWTEANFTEKFTFVRPDRFFLLIFSLLFISFGKIQAVSHFSLLYSVNAIHHFKGR